MNDQSFRIGSSLARLGLTVGLLAALGLTVAGCTTPSASAGVYTYDQAQREQIVRDGTVTKVRPIVIQKAGALVLAWWRVVRSVVWPVARWVVEQGEISLSLVVPFLVPWSVKKSSKRPARTNGLEITVRMDNGETRVIAQADDVPISAGQRVQVISGTGVTRVAPM